MEDQAEKKIRVNPCYPWETIASAKRKPKQEANAKRLTPKT